MTYLIQGHSQQKNPVEDLQIDSSQLDITFLHSICLIGKYFSRSFCNVQRPVILILKLLWLKWIVLFFTIEQLQLDKMIVTPISAD